jgi:hypothetical protein
MHLTRVTGWYPWIPQDARDIDPNPYAYRQVEIAREEWDIPETVDSRSLDPAMHGVDLWWRPVPQAPDARHRFLPPAERYRHDTTFRQLVDMLECLLHDAKTTPTDIRDACLVALIHHEQKALRGLVLRRDQTAPWDMRLEPETPPWGRKER